MSVYVIRYGTLLKIGFSDNLRRRIKMIMQGIPGGDASFVGHMPGDRDVEQHLHGRFSESRFSGEWFRSTPELEAFCSIALDPVMPADELMDRTYRSRDAELVELLHVKDAVRRFAAQMWPAFNHQDRKLALAMALDWKQSRVDDLYIGHKRMVLRAAERQQIGALLETEPTTTSGNTKAGRAEK